MKHYQRNITVHILSDKPGITACCNTATSKIPQADRFTTNPKDSNCVDGRK